MHTFRGWFVGSLFVALLAAGARAEDWQPLWSTAMLSQGNNTVGASAGGKALFGQNASDTFTVDIYDTANNSWSTTSLSGLRINAAAAGAGTKVLIGGGNYDIYDTANSSWTAASLSQARYSLAAAVVGTKVFFGGGTASGYAPSAVVDIYDTANDSWSADGLSQARDGLAAASAGTKVLFGGGMAGGYTAAVDIYDTASGNWSTASLSTPRGYLAAAGAGTQVLFGGGFFYNMAGGPQICYNVVDIYDTVSGNWTTAHLSQARKSMAAASVGTKVFFAGGMTDSTTASDVVDIYDTANGSWTTATLSKSRGNLAAVTVGNQILFAGGYTFPAGSVANVDIYRRQHYDAITSVQNFALVDATVVDGRMQLNGGSLGLGTNNLAVGSMSGVAAVAMGSQTLTVGGDNTSADYAGSVSSVAGLLVKTGTGTQTLSHAGIPFNMLGSVSVNQGVLVLSSGLTSAGGGVSIAAGAGLTAGDALNRAVANNGTLTGPGGADWLTLGGDVMGTGAYAGNVKFAHEFKPGNGGPAHVDLANVAFDAANSLELNVNGTTAGTQYDQLHVSGAATLGGTLVLNLGGFTPSAGQTFALLVGTTSGRFDTLVGVPAGWGIEYAAGGVMLKEISAVSSVAVTPAAASVPVGGTQTFTALALDAGGNVLSTQPSFAWAVTGGGTINAAGVFTAGGAAGGPHTVTAAAGGASGTGTVWVTAAGNQTPTVATAPAANPNPVTAKTTSLTVLGADDGGEGSLPEISKININHFDFPLDFV